MKNKLIISCIKNLTEELSAKRYEEDRIGIKKASLDFLNILEEQNKDLLNILEGLVSDVGNLLSDYDIEWQQAGYYEEAKRLLKQIK